MAECEVCGNEYDKTFEVVAAGVHHTFDSFECAIHLMAPVCEHCGCKVVGHGTEVAGAVLLAAPTAPRRPSTPTRWSTAPTPWSEACRRVRGAGRVATGVSRTGRGP